MSEPPLHILHVVPGLWQHTGGPAQYVPGLCAGLVQAGCRVILATLDGPMADSVLDCQAAGVDVQRFHPDMRHSLWYSRTLARALPALVDQADIVHCHSIWEYPVGAAGALARRRGKPLLVTTHGALEPCALRAGRWKKALAGWLFTRANLQGAACLHATADAEMRSMRSFGLHGPVAVIPNAVARVDPPSMPLPGEIAEHFPACRDKRILLFLSRINPSKGLLDLAAVWEILAPRHPDWHLLIAGPDERGHLQEVKDAFARRGLAERVTFAGPVFGDSRMMAFAAAELFILPTYNENFGIVVAEALSFGIPAITTHGAPWEGLQTRRCGWWTPYGADGIRAALQEALALSPAALAAMGSRGRAWVEQSFTWEANVREMLAVYRWVTKRQAIPACVVPGSPAGPHEV